MGGGGWANPFPLELGGAPTLVENIEQALHSAVGRGGSADDPNGIEGLVRQCTAIVLAAAASTGERAVLNAFPAYATDLLPYYEDLFLIVPEDELDLPSRRAGASARYTAEVQASIPDLTADLQRIDPRFSILEIPHAQSFETLLARCFQDYAATLPFNGGRKSTRFGNYSTDFILHVTLTLGDGVVPGLPEKVLIQRAIDYLNPILPTWNHFQIAAADGFHADISRLDLTTLT